MLFHKDNSNKEHIDGEIPLSVYKVLISHEDFETFEYLKTAQFKFSKNWGYELLKYSISCSSPLFILYFSKDLRVNNKAIVKDIINELLSSIKSSRQYIGNSTWHYTICLKNKIFSLEEKLYILEQLLNRFSFGEVKTFVKVVKSFYELEVFNPDELNLNDSIQLHKLQNLPLAFATNPIKLWVLIVKMLLHLNKTYPNRELKEVCQKLCKLWSAFIANTESLEEIDLMLRDKTYSGLDVIDIIGNSGFDEMLENDKICNFINDIWIGPFDRESIMSISTTYKILSFNKEQLNNSIFK